MKCDACGNTSNDVLTSQVYWTTWGRNCFDFNWSKNDDGINLCEKCEEDNWYFCEECGALIDIDFVGGGYISDNPDYDYLCPECAKKYN